MNRGTGLHHCRWSVSEVTKRIWEKSAPTKSQSLNRGHIFRDQFYYCSNKKWWLRMNWYVAETLAPMKANFTAPTALWQGLIGTGPQSNIANSEQASSGEFGAEAITILWLHHAGIRVAFTFWAMFQYKDHVSSYGDSHYRYDRDHPTDRTASLYWKSFLGPRPVYYGKQDQYHRYHQISNMRRVKSPNLNVSRLISQLSLPNPLKPCVESGTKM